MAENDILQIVFNCLLPDDVVAKNVYYVQQTSVDPFQDSNMLDDLELYIEAIYSEIEGGIDGEITVLLADVMRRDTVLDTWERVGEFLPGTTFSLTAEMVSHGVAFVLRAMTAFGKSIARKFIAGFPETVITQSLWDSATLTAMVGFASAWIDEFTDGIGDYTPGTWRTTANEFAEFSGVTFLNVLNGYQRRRQPGAGE